MSGENFSVLNTAGVASNFYPLTLSWKQDGREWAVYFQSKPTYQVYRTGDMPTRDELVDVLAYTPMPVLFVHVLETIVATCEVRGGENDKTNS